MAEKPLHPHTTASSSQQSAPISTEENRFLPLKWFNKIALFAWHFHRKLLISLIISLAIVLLLFRTLAFYLEENPEIVQHFVESQLQGSVTFEQIKVDSQLFFPAVSLYHFTFKAKSGSEKQLKFTSASVRLNTLLSIVYGQPKIDTIAVEGVSVLLRRNKNNELSIAEFLLDNKQKNAQSQGRNIHAYLELFNQTNFIMTESEIYFIDEMEEFPSVFVSDISFKMKNKDSRHQVSLLAKLNDSDTRLDLRLDFSGQIDALKNWDGKIYGAIDNLNHQALLHFFNREMIQIKHFKVNDIKANTKFWTTIEKGKLQSIYGELDIVDTNLTRIDTEQSINFDQIVTHFKLQRGDVKLTKSGLKEFTWALDLFDFNIDINYQKIADKYINLTFHNIEKQPISKVQLFLNHLDLREVSQVIGFFSPNEFNKNIYKILKPRGHLKNVLSTVHVNALQMPVDIEHYQVQADISQFGMNSLVSLPKVRNFSTRVVFDETMGRAYINSTDMKLHLKSLFRDSWPVTQLSGEFFWQQENDEWLLGAEKLALNNPHLNATADLNLWFLKNGQTFMDLSGFYHDANVKFVPYYLPAKIMSEGLVNWLDSAFLSGTGTDGGVVYRGALAQFPYEDHSGVMDIVFNTQDVLLDYNKGWPLLSDIDAQVQFTERGMGVKSKQSKIFSSVSNNIEVDLESYLESVLKLTGDINSNVDDGLNFLKQSKLVSDDVLDILNAKGDIGLNLDVTISLKKGKTDSKVLVKLDDNIYYPPGFDRKDTLVNHIKGDILVHNDSVNAKNMTAEIMGQAAKISIMTRKQGKKSNKDPNVSVNINSKVSIKQLKNFNLIPELLMPLSAQLSGSPAIKLAIDLPNKQRKLTFKLHSDLKNLQSDLPVPYKKKASQVSSFKLNFSEIKNNQSNDKLAQLKLAISNELSLALFLDTSSDHFKLLKGNVAFKGAKARLPKENLLRLTGSLNELPLDEWQSVFSSYRDKETKKITSQSSASQFTLPVELSLKQVILPEYRFGTKVPKAARLSQTKKNQTKIKSNEDKDPGGFPLINGTINTLKMGKVDFGRFTIKTSRVDRDVVFDSLTLKGPLLSFEGKGKWHYWNEYPEVDFEGVAHIPSSEKLLIALGNDQLIRNGKLKLSGYMSWIGGLSDFSKENIEGKVNLISENGAWIEGKPGTAGRLLGLLNMNALVRRFSLDFSDVSKEGFEFDKVEADMRFNKGTIYTDNFRISSPSAKILMTGSTSLVSERFDQRVTVIPEISATLPLAGAAVAGPAGAAVVWVGQKLLGDQLNQVTAFDYTIKGNWDDPEIKKDKTNRNTVSKIIKMFGLDKEKSETQNYNPLFDENNSEYP
ncbi:MAG: hypothetical protein KZQ64_10065 [gamma proteobacterium symbiont of Bathyaustriella thionipta]|nr:hypothetical protein [gamma proteobacterium symbiont of Bathyaustriella thionipta]MCU7948647.1 hypothetical protein [gamma proteobacterium symbiont of Bathyaustriella thionipta]MCU7953715.1 hypothetical protein [gamma proteobacterium symbiont of Bathyaustriella thionipta]MCU7955178.1 hypothetical protein [gamma proteobacterium symbiont of Bathyaustriella thionipta]MCU7968706.1 hypothetical protein [gamma proteobacterium symbiont of Bathyaustriella thionipta]